MTQQILLEATRKLLEVLQGRLDKNVPVAFLVEGKEDSINVFITAEWTGKLFTSCLRGQVNCLRPLRLRGRVSLRIHRAGS